MFSFRQLIVTQVLVKIGILGAGIFFSLLPLSCAAQSSSRMLGAGKQVKANASAGDDSSAPPIPILNWRQRSDWTNVKTDVTPNAVGDGVHDDTAAIQAALDQAGGSGKSHTVYLPPGTYRITQTLTLVRIQGAMIVGHGRTTRLLWDGPVGGSMYISNGVSRCRYVGLTWDGAGKAAVGIEHQSQSYYETSVRHQDEAFLNFTAAGIRIGNGPATPTAEVMYWNCLFQHCGNGILLLAFNDYDNDVAGCVFQDCGTAINVQRGNVYARDCRFERSTQRDLFLGNHSHSLRRCLSFGSAQFLSTGQGRSTLEVMMQDCRVDGWTSKGGALSLGMRGPSIISDCAFTHAPDHAPPIRLTNAAGVLQMLALSDVTAPQASALVAKGPEANVIRIPNGNRHGSLLQGNEDFFQTTRTVPGRVFDAKRDFGATANGRGDDTEAILATVNAARTAGHGAIAYLPAGHYLLSHTVPISGSDYTVGGAGYLTSIEWTGSASGTMFQVTDPHNITVEQLAPFAHMNTVCRVQQTGSKPSEVTYDGIYVSGSFLGHSPLTSDGKTGDAHGILADEELRGLECVDLPAKAIVHIKHFVGTMRFLGCGRATILADFVSEGIIRANGAVPDTGFLGCQTHAFAGNPCDIVVQDNQSLVVADAYTESTNHHLSLSGSAAAAKLTGHVTIHGVKVLTYQPDPINVDNYQGRLAYVGAHFQYTPYTIAHSGSAPCRITLIGNTFWQSEPQLPADSAADLTLLQNVVAGQATLDTRQTIHNRVVHNTATPKSVLKTSSPLLPGAADALDDLQALGRWDLYFTGLGR